MNVQLRSISPNMQVKFKGKEQDDFNETVSGLVQDCAGTLKDCKSVADECMDTLNSEDGTVIDRFGKTKDILTSDRKGISAEEMSSKKHNENFEKGGAAAVLSVWLIRGEKLRKGVKNVFGMLKKRAIFEEAGELAAKFIKRITGSGFGKKFLGPLLGNKLAHAGLTVAAGVGSSILLIFQLTDAVKFGLDKMHHKHLQSNDSSAV